MDNAELHRAIESSDLAPVYLIHGPENFLRREAVRMLLAAARERDIDTSEPEPRDVDITSLLDDLRTPGLFAAARMVIVDDASALIAGAADLLAAYAEHPGANATLVLAAETIDGRKKGMKALLKKAASVECPAVRPYEVPAWCVRRARGHGKPMDSAAARLLVDLAGTNLGQIDGQIEALATYCHDKPRIASEDVMNLVGGDHARTVWELVRAISERAPKTALGALNRLVREPKVTPSWIIGSLARESRDLWRTKRLVDEGCSPGEIQTRLGKPQWLVRRILQATERVDQKRLRANYRRILQADVDTKTGAGSDEWILEALVVRLCAT